MFQKIIGPVLGGITLIAGLGGAAPVAKMQQYYPSYPGVYCFPGNEGCWPIIYLHEIYSDEGLTNLIGSGSDTCSESGGMVYRSEPSLPVGYEVKTPLYLCMPGGPYEIPAME